LAGSLYKDGFTFDHTGHLLHLHDPYGKELILGLLKDNVHLLERSSWIFSHGVFTRYPFQANTYGLPRKVVDDCVVGFLKAAREDLPFHRRTPDAGHRRPDCMNFRDWTLRTFGGGIARHFMFPYNSKLWRVSLNRMTTEWVAPFVPRPQVAEVLYGALTEQKKHFGYNATFHYPIRGGIQSLPDALAGRVADSIQTGCPAQRIDFRQRLVEAANLGEVRYQRLVNTLPLVELIDMLEGAPPSVQADRAALSWVKVHCLNLGIRRGDVSDKHWIYFPERRFPFYRVGFCSNFSPFVAPEGTSSMYIEFSAEPEARLDTARLEKTALRGLRECGLLKPSDELATKLWISIPFAYVIYDRHRSRVLPRIFAWLQKQGIETIGRYGAWKYSFMEEAVLDGKRCAQRLLGIAPAEPAHKPHPAEELRSLK